MQGKTETASALFRVGGLRDEMGRQEIEHNLIQVDGVREVKIFMPEQEVAILYDPEVIRAEYLERTLNSLGYSPYVR